MGKRTKHSGAVDPFNCAWCGRAIPDEHEVFGMGARARPEVDLEPYRGRTIEVHIATLGRKVPAIVVSADSEAAREGKDFVFMTCSETCAAALKAAVGEDVQLGRELLGP